MRTVTYLCRLCPEKFADIEEAEDHIRPVHQLMAFLLSTRLRAGGEGTKATK